MLYYRITKQKVRRFGASACANTQHAMLLEALLLGGVPDPRIEVNSTAAQLALPFFSAAGSKLCAAEVIGFSGWRLIPSGQIVSGEADLDQLVFGQPEFMTLPKQIRTHIVEQAAKLPKCSGRPRLVNANANSADCKADAPLRGPDDPSQVHYDPSVDDSGCFEKMQFDNNCYNYGNDVLTNTFAQPGRGTGVCSHHDRPCVNNTCADVRRAAESDGLTWAGTDLPTALPSIGHYVSLHIWPETNFHWIRMDANMTWSHKPGGSPVRDHDNDGKTITDPGKANFTPWTKHCGYMRTTPSQVELY